MSTTTVQTKPEKVVMEEGFQPVEYWNARYPNHELIQRNGPNEDSDRKINFFAGYFRATQPWQVEVIEQELKDIAFRADSPEEWVCETCGWPTKSSKAYMHHIRQHP